MVCIDGRAGSGKSTLGALLAVALRSAAALQSAAPTVHLLHTDDLLEGWADPPSILGPLRDGVLEPLAVGRTGSYRRYDWTARRFATEPATVPVPGVLIVEGVTSAAAPMRTWSSLSVWVECDPAAALQRGLARDGEAMRGEWEQWQCGEAAHFAADGTMAAVDLVVDGRAGDPAAGQLAVLADRRGDG